jgi:hypothetical protein
VKERKLNNENHHSTPSLHPAIIGLAILFAAITFIGVTGKKVPLLSNVRVDIILLVIIGMTICTQGGIGRVAAMGQWTHPLSIIGYLLGGLILIITLAVFVGWKLPFIANDQQTLLAIAILGKAQSSECCYALSVGTS